MDQFSRFRQNNSTMDHLAIHQRLERPGVYSHNPRILDEQESRRQALLAQTETVYASEKTRKAAILRRLNLRGSPPSTPPLDASEGTSGWCNGPNMAEHGRQRSPDPEYDDEVGVSRDWSYSRSGNHTPEELRALPLITSSEMSGPQKPHTPPPAARALPMHLPVMTVMPNRADNDVPGGYHLEKKASRLPVLRVKAKSGGKDVACDHLERVQKGSEHLFMNAQPSAAQRNNVPVKAFTEAPAPKPKPPQRTGTSRATLQPTPPPRNTVTKEATLAPTAPSKPAPPKMAGNPQRQSFRPAQTIVGAKMPEAARNIKLKELTPLFNSEESLPLSLSLLSTTDWEKKTKGLQHIQALAQHDPEVLKERLPEVCNAVIAEVKNLRSCVASVAIDTIEYLHVYLGRDMDNFAEHTGGALLQKIAQSSGSVFLQKQTTRAMNSLVQYCSPGAVLNVMLTPGLSHLSAAVRACAAEKLHMLADSLGASAIMTAKTNFTRNFVIAVNKMSVDAAADVRPHGLTILSEIALEPAFKKVWMSVVQQKDRTHMEKILRKMGAW